MRKKAEVIINAAVELDCDVLILSAFGCGAFHNPPDQAALFFKEALNEVGTEHTLQEVVLCIFEDHNSGQWRNPRGNLAPFEEAFGQGVTGRRMPETERHFPRTPEAAWPPGAPAWVGVEPDASVRPSGHEQ
eukprot:11579529-Alexandrium_andersonii.AAC.1